MTFSTRNFEPLTPYSFSHETHCCHRHTRTCATKFLHHLGTGCCLPPKLEGAGLEEHPKLWDPLHISATVEASNFKFGTQLGFGTSLPKTTFRTKIGEGLGQGSIQKIGTPYLFLQPLKLATSNLVHNLGLGLDYQKATFKTKIGGGLGQGSIQKIWDHLRIFATVEASDFKFGTQTGFGTSLPKNDVQDQNWRRSGLGEHPKNLGPPTYFCNR